MLKTLTFAALHFSTAFSVTYVLTGSIGVSGAVALVEPLINTVVFYFHEKAWNLYEKKNKTVQQTQPFQLHRCS
ncbi:TPA: DUF2061 domain-containing protein [Neisseria meningitidis]|uniref:DUF2061 domain-containing protein n=1 Tax=Neisseria meningitidis TaxID=487 RepID=UPI000E57EDA2|nr:DUF2061 domain-containing protein [Neisseria meningitidis]MBH2049497.1 DUF2061 domain-containing protein [Neisseria meningitidis]MBH2250400.1 DUF2061 domain-containing protein [Neisseria meningitidis]MBH5612206.1 DUF2061 domain-containing protein [Neisseria meningitidis]MBH5667293.1 DUF2061 domain-containing protein [Neisseria meningitidis]MBH5798076.1 DUF2061 domain-containing protein [Neisseria meningitidis]